ncbi:MAG: hypothetical protein JSV34_02345 [Candidatus Omnitrophota bacterium]|nr:MAG: hypothetical protein JSV34_02345 [Candidatus Omnitrophota bacterium]
MKREIFLIFLPIFLFLSIFPFIDSFSSFEPVEGLEDVRIKRVAISPFNNKLIYIVSENSLFRSEDGGAVFKKVSVFKDETAQHIFFDSYLANTLYIATSRHVFKVEDKLQRIFSSPDEAMILTVGKFKEAIYVGTTEGCYMASQDLLNWRKLNGLGADTFVYSIAGGKKNLYFATSRGVYLMDEEDRIQRIFVIRDSQEDSLVANIIKVDVFDKNRIWLGTNQGIFSSEDGGLTWGKMYIEGIDNIYINALAQTDSDRDALYLGTTRGFFRIDLKAKTSTSILEGIYATEVFWVEFNPSGESYLATSGGLFRNGESVSYYQEADYEAILLQEPSITEVQNAALYFNEVHPEKIQKWRNALKKRALYPSVAVKVDGSVDDTYEIYTSATKHYYVTGPADRSVDWSVSFSWDIGDLVWNMYEDDVDTRSRLNTQVRLDILDEINRVYFERLRLRREIAISSLSGDELFQKKLRLEEFNAIINGYTGGFFSKKLEELNGKK